MIEINGEKYVLKERTKSDSKASAKLFPIMAIASMFGGLPEFKTPERPTVDIVEEYKLILQKKSRLSKSQRDWVVAQFKYNYVKVDDSNSQ